MDNDESSENKWPLSGVFMCVCIPGGGSSSSSVGVGMRDLFGSRSSKSFIT